MTLLASGVKCVHTALILFIVIVPLLMYKEHILSIHLLITGLIMLHWLLNNNVCALTTLEAKLRGVEDTGETFIGKFVNPVYELTDRKIWVITGGLFLICALKLNKYYKFDLLKNILRLNIKPTECVSTSLSPSSLRVSSAVCSQQ